ncbi:nucleotidyltransferase domain-containing protein [Phormidium pseudopriestleyi FRX01]|uniref:Nucleotidyltransferase domain-containing protein n=1 Tax=Phormidium pseudopriestleyi FRX01 TaxID=1759528 RepID=A0ABS3FQ12_9CYAN|nr:nucleotidyltransferase domain-containing protein [Phormidium pseudopriestleyi]MBO0349204.1 nucleotidyltransferase domain-containing protein [Phormidium pseudopriestleyi FRX01]
MKNQIGLSIQDLLNQQRSQIIDLAEKHGAYNVRVFGSVARGEATADSDIDFLVDYDLEKITHWFPGGLLLDLEQLLNRKVDIVTVDMLKERIRDRILLEAVKL